MRFHYYLRVTPIYLIRITLLLPLLRYAAAAGMIRHTVATFSPLIDVRPVDALR